MTPKQYITQITAEDMRELSAVTNLKAGWLIRIDKNEDGVTISVDQTALALAINGFIRNRGGQVNAVVAANEISFDPPY